MSATFDRFYAEAADHDGVDLASDIERGAVWHEPATRRSLRMYPVSHRRITPEQFASLVERGIIVRDSLPLSADVEIWVAPSKRAVPQ